MRAREQRADLHLLKIGALHGSQVHLAQESAEVPPAATRPGREVTSGATVVDAHDQPVDPVPKTVQVHFEWQVGPVVAANEASVQPHGRAVVDRLEADDPPAGCGRHIARERTRRQREIPAIPADVAVHARGGQVAGVVRIRDCRRGPADGRGNVSPPALRHADVGAVGAVQPLAAEQVAPAGPVGVQRAPRGRWGNLSACRSGADERQHENQKRHAAAASDHLCAGFGA